jgi:hypothetical protein
MIINLVRYKEYGTSLMRVFDKTFLFDRKSIKQEKDRIKEINWAKGKGSEGVYWKKRGLAGLDFTNRKK